MENLRAALAARLAVAAATLVFIVNLSAFLRPAPNRALRKSASSITEYCSVNQLLSKVPPPRWVLACVRASSQPLTK